MADCYLEGALAAAERLAATLRTMVANDNANLTPVVEHFLAARVRADTVINNLLKFTDDYGVAGKTPFHDELNNALGTANFKFARPDLLGEY